MAKRRDRPSVNPLLRDHVTAIVGPAGQGSDGASERAQHAARSPDRPRVTPDDQRASPTKRKNGVQIKARFTKAEGDEIERFTRTLSSYLQLTVMGSEVTRALWTLALRSQDQLAELATSAPRMERPPYADKLAMAQYEDAVADYLLRALKQTPRG